MRGLGFRGLGFRGLEFRALGLVLVMATGFTFATHVQLSEGVMNTFQSGTRRAVDNHPELPMGTPLRDSGGLHWLI